MFTRAARIILLGLIMLAAGPVLAGKKYVTPFQFEPVTDADWAVVVDSAKQIHDAAMLFEKVHISDGVLKNLSVRQLKKKNSHRAVYRRIRILSEAGREWGDVEAPFFSLEQETVTVLGRTILLDGSIITLMPEHIFEKEIVNSRDQEYTQTNFSLPGVTDDCIVEYIIVARAPYSYREWQLQKSIPLLVFSYHWVLWQMNLTQEYVDFFADNPLYDFTIPNYLWLNSSSFQNIEKLPNVKETKALLFESRDIPPFEAEPYCMPENSQKDRLLCYYGSRVSPAGYWGALALSSQEYATEFCEKNKRVKEVAERFQGLTTDEDKIGAAYSWITQNIRNISYLDLYDEKNPAKVIKPKERKSVDDVIKYGYGSIRDINLLFWDMLRELNIDAKYGYGKDRFDDLFLHQAKYDQFDRSLVAIPSAMSRYEFYNPGMACTPDYLVPWFLEGTTALLCDADENLVTIPFSAPKANVAVINTDLRLDEDMAVTGQVEASYAGHLARSIRVKIYDELIDEHQALLEETVKETYPDAEPDSILYSDLNDASKPFVLNFGLAFPSVTEMAGRILLKPADYISRLENSFVTEERTGPILFDYAKTESELATFSLPEGWHVDALPTDTSFSNKIGECTVSFGRDETGRLLFRRDFVLNLPYWQPEDYNQVRRLYGAYQAMNERIVVLKKL